MKLIGLVILALLLLLFFYFVGKRTRRKEQGVTLPIKSQISKEPRRKLGETHYPPGFDEPFENSHSFKLFDSEAVLAWNNGDDVVAVWCATAFSKGKRQTNVYSVHHYNRRKNYWSVGPPRGAANECKAEIARVLKGKQRA